MAKFIAATLLVIIYSNVLFSQSENKNQVVFVFEKESYITKHFETKNPEKQIGFIIRGIENDAEAAEFAEKMKQYRGVIDFGIGDKMPNGDRPASITLYEYADHWLYFENLFYRNDVKKIILEGQEIESEKLTEIKNK
ncbi:MAG: hypothetical protein ABIJ16_01485 [Bacteroidota bacterium]